MTQLDHKQALDDLNSEASDRFEQIRKRLGLNLGFDPEISTKEFKSKLGNKSFENMQNRRLEVGLDKAFDEAIITEVGDKEEIQKREYIDGVFSFINSLNLPPNLACTIGYIISYKKTNNIAELEMALESIEKEINK